MPRKGKQPLTPREILDKIRAAGLTPTDVISRRERREDETLDSLPARVQHILSLTAGQKSNPGHMLFFVMYDIESNKVRNLVAKYLIRQGCYRIQHSIFLADLTSAKCEEIKEDLVQVQAAYDNHDSILVVPISTDYLLAMRVIGKAIDVKVIMHSQNTLFF